MKRIYLGLLLSGALAIPQVATAASNTTVGVGTGAVAGALIAGPIGAVVGGIVGGVVGFNSERARPRRVRRVRAARVGSRKVRVSQTSVAPTRPPELVRTRTVSGTSEPAPKAAPATTGWQNPR